MLRSFLSLLLVASLLFGGLMPCCVASGETELPDAAAAETGGCGHGKPAQPDADPPMDCDDCSHCLQPASPLRSLIAMSALAPGDAVATPNAAAPPVAPRAPLLRPPIRKLV